MFLTGTGGSAGLSSSVNAAAKSFTDLTRASATGTVLAGFGLSAFVFSIMGQSIFHGEAGGLLLLLSIGTSVPMLVGSFIIRPVPPKRVAEGYQRVSTTMDPDNSEPPHSPLELTRSRSRSASPGRGRSRHHTHFDSNVEERDPELAKPMGPRSESLASLSPTSISMSPLDLLASVDFYMLFVILALLCGTGLMYINNVGTVALALARNGQVEYDRRAVSRWQASQVAIVSIWNCSGRILGGMLFLSVYPLALVSDFRNYQVWSPICLKPNCVFEG